LEIIILVVLHSEEEGFFPSMWACVCAWERSGKPKGKEPN